MWDLGKMISVGKIVLFFFFFFFFNKSVGERMVGRGNTKHEWDSSSFGYITG